MAESSPLAHSPTLVQGTGRDGSVAPSDADLEPGASVGEYVVEKFLGAGAMGEVYAGIQPVIGKKVAIKVLKREVAATADGAERFKREARAVNQIDHPNVIDVFSFGRTGDGRLYLVMDLVEGRSLRKAITAGPLPLPVALDVLGQIAGALDAAHAKGVIHRDLKPDNVMVSGGPDSGIYKVFVLDFGLAKLLTPDGVDPKTSMLTGQGVWLGTPGYMAPEQWSADGAVPASDRYALGVMAFELLAGTLPFEAKSLPQMMEQHFRAKVPALSARGAIALPSAFDPIVARAMAKDPDARYASAGEMVDALRAAAGSKGRSRSAATAPDTKKLWLPAAVGAGVLALSIGAVLSLRGGGNDGDDRDTRPNVNPTPPSADGMVRIDVDSVPRGATVTRGSMSTSTTTPTTLEAKDGEAVAFDVSKPGYATVHHEVVARAGVKIAPIALALITGFEGVWMLPDGSLRHFRRDGERVTASKLASVDGARAFFRQYDLIPATSGASFSTTENIHEPGRPEHPSCYFPYTTEYHYDPASDHLTVRREHIVSDVIEGKCVQKSSKMMEPEHLVRADRATSTERESLAPVGKPTQIDTVTLPGEKKPTPKKEPPKKGLEPFEKKGAAQQNKEPPPKQVKAPPQLQREDNLPNAPVNLDDVQAKTAAPANNKAPPSQNATPPLEPQPRANEPPAQQQITPQQAVPPPQQVQPRGDSQVAPQIKGKKK
ncbi:MAG: serine/threonine protein kinase [Kofleriaceae bacterium]